ncbi:MAG: helix-turn-helix domain-containing protein [Lachnospiraceae bacterium]
MKTKEKRSVLADRINRLCKERRITYYSLAYKSTVPLTTLLHIVDGSTKNPGIFTIIKICDGLEITLKDFFDTEDFLQVLKEDLD